MPEPALAVHIRQRPCPPWPLPRPLRGLGNERRAFRPRIRVPIRDAEPGRQRQTQRRNIIRPTPIQRVMQCVRFRGGGWRVRKGRVAVCRDVRAGIIVRETRDEPVAWRSSARQVVRGMTFGSFLPQQAFPEIGNTFSRKDAKCAPLVRVEFLQGQRI